MENQSALVAELRENFLKKLEDEEPPDPKNAKVEFHPLDIQRVQANDDWLRRFLEHNEYNVQESLNMLWESCTWRKKFGTNDITEENVKREYLEEGSVFTHGKDKDGKLLLIIKLKLHVKGTKDFAELQRCVVYWFERLEREGNGNQISIFFDMLEAGLSNVDMEFTKYLIGLFKTYYPNFLNYILIFEMPWILSTAFKIIKSWLPAKAIPKIKFLNKSNLKEFVDANNALKCWGGNDSYVYSFVSEIPTGDSAMNGTIENKKVHFADGSPMTEQPPGGFVDHTNDDQMLSIQQEAIAFHKEGNEIVGMIVLKNVTTDKPLSYKIKTTSPEKFKVKPSLGILLPSEQCNITIVLQAGCSLRGQVHSDRFLVMCLPLENANTSIQELASIWKDGKPAEEHRLKCYSNINGNNGMQKSHSTLSSNSAHDNVDTVFSKITGLEESYNKLHKEIVSIKYLLLYSVILLTILGVVIIAYSWRSDIRNSTDEQNCCFNSEL